MHTYKAGKSLTYSSWAHMIQRCENPKCVDYKWYGGRGIKVCERWRNSFEAFYADVGDRPKGMTLDRWPDNDGDYELSNFRWATPREQRLNSRPGLCGSAKQRWFRAWHKDMMCQFMSNNQHEFARQHKLDRSTISACLRKKRKQHKGWRFKLLEINI